MQVSGAPQILTATRPNTEQEGCRAFSHKFWNMQTAAGFDVQVSYNRGGFRIIQAGHCAAELRLQAVKQQSSVVPTPHRISAQHHRSMHLGAFLRPEAPVSIIMDERGLLSPTSSHSNDLGHGTCVIATAGELACGADRGVDMAAMRSEASRPVLRESDLRACAPPGGSGGTAAGASLPPSSPLLVVLVPPGLFG